jgi:hypothetical protein
MGIFDRRKPANRVEARYAALQEAIDVFILETAEDNTVSLESVVDNLPQLTGVDGRRLIMQAVARKRCEKEVGARPDEPVRVRWQGGQASRIETR